MRDSRIQIFVPTTLDATTTSVSGPGINLLDGYTYNGTYFEGTTLYGFPFEVMGSSAVIGNDADGFTLTWKVQAAPDSSGSPGTYTDLATIGVMAYDETNGWTKDGTLTGSALGLTRAKMSGRVVTTKPWVRLVCTSGSLTGTASVLVRAWIVDGAHPFPDSGRIY